MSQDPHSPGPSPPPVGAVYTGPVLVAPLPTQPAWPTVVGIISLCVAGLSLACDTIGLIGQLIVMLFVQPSVGAMQPGFRPGWATASTLLTTGADMIATVVLLIGGVLLLKRRPLARPLHLVYGVATFAIVMINATMFVVMIRQATVAAATMPATGPASGPAMPSAARGMLFGGITGGIGMAISLIYPIFLLVWFLRRPIVEQVRQWAASAGARPEGPDWGPSEEDA